MKKYRFEECYAKLILEQVLPSRFCELSIFDKPDLQNINAGIGVEVTTAVSENDKEKDSLFSRLEHNRRTQQQLERYKSRIKQLGGTYHDGGIMFSWVDVRNLNQIYSAFEDKLSKLKDGGYHLFEEQFVFITHSSIILQEEIDTIQAELTKRQQPYNYTFDGVFLYYLYGKKLIEFNMKSGDSRCHEIKDFIALTDKAYRMAHGIQ